MFFTFERRMYKFIRPNKASKSIIKMVQPFDEDPTKAIEEKIDFAYSFRPNYLFSRIFGLMPFSIAYDSSRVQVPRVGALDGCWFVISICLYILLAVIAYQNIILPKDSHSYLTILGDSATLILGLIIGALMIGMDMYNRFKIIGIWQMFKTFDEEVNTFFPL